MSYSLPLILLYHKIKELEPKSSLCVPASDFRRHIAYLLENNFHVVSLHDIITQLSQNKTVAITFDDGYRNNYLEAYPVLAEFKIPATVFIVAGLVGKKSIWDEENGWPSDELMNWPQIKEIGGNNISIGSHSLNHINLTKIKWWPNIWREINYSKRTIEEKTEKKVLFFSYPFGKSNILIRQMVRKAGYVAACGTGWPNDRPRDLYNLPRLEINTDNGPMDKFISLMAKYVN